MKLSDFCCGLFSRCRKKEEDLMTPPMPEFGSDALRGRLPAPLYVSELYINDPSDIARFCKESGIENIVKNQDHYKLTFSTVETLSAFRQAVSSYVDYCEQVVPGHVLILGAPNLDATKINKKFTFLQISEHFHKRAMEITGHSNRTDTFGLYG